MEERKIFIFKAEVGIRDSVASRELGDVNKKKGTGGTNPQKEKHFGEGCVAESAVQIHKQKSN